MRRPTVGYTGRGDRLDRALRKWLGELFADDLSAVRVHTGPTAGQVCQSAGAVALAHGADLLFAPGRYDPDTPAGRRLIAHEVAHVIQQRRPRKSDPGRRPRSPAWLEAEADRAAAAALIGRPYQVLPAPGCPAWQPGLPFFLAVGALAILVGGAAYLLSSEEDVQRDAAQIDMHTYETLWGFVPVVGSLDQMMNGRTRTQRALGGAFLVLDASLVGGVLLKGIMVAVSRRALLRATATAAERAASEQLLANGARFGTWPDMVQAIRAAAAQGPVVLAASEGPINHSVSYVIANGRIWKMHGGPLQMFFSGGSQPFTGAVAARIAGRANTLSLYPVAQNVAQETVQWWSGQLAAGRFAMFTAAEGCAGTQVALLNRAGLGGAEALSGMAGRSRFVNPLFPLFLDEARVAGTAGTHIVTNQFAGAAARGSAAQLGTQALVQGTGREAAWTVNWSNALDERYEVLTTARQTGANQLPVGSLTAAPPDGLEGVILEEVTPEEFAAAMSGMVTTSSMGDIVITLPDAPAGGP